MKKYPNYSAMARSIATQDWSEVNTSYKTNQNFTYYFDCAGHGGYVVIFDKLTQEQKDEIVDFYNGYDNIPFTKVAVNLQNSKFKTHSKWDDSTVRLYPDKYANLNFISFEEDCDWAIAEYIGIHTIEKEYTKERQEYTDKSYKELKEKYATYKG